MIQPWRQALPPQTWRSAAWAAHQHIHQPQRTAETRADSRNKCPRLRVHHSTTRTGTRWHVVRPPRGNTLPPRRTGFVCSLLQPPVCITMLLSSCDRWISRHFRKVVLLPICDLRKAGCACVCKAWDVCMIRRNCITRDNMYDIARAGQSVSMRIMHMTRCFYTRFKSRETSSPRLLGRRSRICCRNALLAPLRSQSLYAPCAALIGCTWAR